MAKPPPSSYTKLNFASFAATCFFTVSFVVFMSSTQAFFLTDVLGVHERIGDYIGTLGVADEILVIILSPFLGALSDKIGAKYIAVFGVFTIGVSLFVYTTAKHVYPGLLFARLFFALGACSAASMMTALLAELSTSGFNLSSLLFWRKTDDNIILGHDEDEESDNLINTTPEKGRRNGKLTSVIGISAGLGALFSASFYIPLPARLGRTEPPVLALKHSYYIVGSVAIVASLFLSYGLFSAKSFKIPILSKYLSPYDEILEELDQEEIEIRQEEEAKTYFQLLKMGFAEAKDSKICLAYMGAVLSRANTVVTAVFVPLYVTKYYHDEGLCSREDRTSCPEAYVTAAIISGIVHVASLIFAPIFGFCSDKFGRKNLVLLACIFGFIGASGFAFAGNPKSARGVIFACFFGVGQIGSIITSLSLCTDEKRGHNGAISGVYGLFGGMGILIVSKIGGYSADYWVGAPFIIVASFDVILFFATLYIGGKFDFVLSKITAFKSRGPAITLREEQDEPALIA